MSVMKIIGSSLFALISTVFFTHLIQMALYDSIGARMTESTVRLSIVIGAVSFLVVLIVGTVNRFKQ